MLETKSFTIEELAIIRQVEKICKSDEFKNKSLLCDFLSYTVSEYLAGRGDLIKGYSVGVDVFGKDEDFDPGQDALVRIHAGRLRRMLDLYYLRSGKEDEIRIEIPKGGYSPIFSTMEPMTRDKGVQAVIASHDEEMVRPSVVILPFKNLTGDVEKEFFAQGFTEELSIELTKYEDLMVYDCIHGSNLTVSIEDYTDFIRQKKARFVIEGAVNQAGQQVKVLVKLSNFQDGKHIWAESYTKQLTADNLIDIQETIAKVVAGVLGSEYGIILQNLTSDSLRIKPQHLDTYCAVLKFYYFQANQTALAAAQAFEALHQALHKDPESGITAAMLAAMHGNRYMLDHPQAEESFRFMGELAEKAYRLDPNSIMVKVILAFKYFAYNERERFFQLADECLKINPTISIRLGSLAFHYSLYGGWERGKEIMDRLMGSRIGYPLYFHGSTTLYHYRKKAYGHALSEVNKYNIPSLFWSPMLKAAILGQLDQRDQAGSQIEKLLELKPDFKEKATFLISRYVKEDELVEHVMDGLRKAGMAL